MRRQSAPILTTTLFLVLANRIGLPQDQRPRDERQRDAVGQPGDRTGGTVSSVGVGSFQITRRDGSSLTVLVNDQTRLQEDQKTIQLEDLKTGDHVLVIGQAGGQNQMAASAVRRLTQQDLQQFQGSRAFGRITAINDNQITVTNRREGEKTLTVNDQTTFTKDEQPISLKDLKAGDMIMARGKEENGQFVATEIVSRQFQPQRQGLQRRPPQPTPDANSDNH